MNQFLNLGFEYQVILLILLSFSSIITTDYACESHVTA
jgi:hypothetical protein